MTKDKCFPEAFSEPSRTSDRVAIFAKKKSIIDMRLGSKYASVF